MDLELNRLRGSAGHHSSRQRGHGRRRAGGLCRYPDRLLGDDSAFGMTAGDLWRKPRLGECPTGRGDDRRGDGALQPDRAGPSGTPRRLRSDPWARRQQGQGLGSRGSTALRKGTTLAGADPETGVLREAKRDGHLRCDILMTAKMVEKRLHVFPLLG